MNSLKMYLFQTWSITGTRWANHGIKLRFLIASFPMILLTQYIAVPKWSCNQENIDALSMKERRVKENVLQKQLTYVSCHSLSSRASVQEVSSSNASPQSSNTVSDAVQIVLQTLIVKHTNIQKTYQQPKSDKLVHPSIAFVGYSPKCDNEKQAMENACMHTCRLHFWYIKCYNTKVSSSQNTLHKYHSYKFPNDPSSLWVTLNSHNVHINLLKQLLTHTEDKNNLQPMHRWNFRVQNIVLWFTCYSVLGKTVERNNFKSGDNWWFSNKGVPFNTKHLKVWKLHMIENVFLKYVSIAPHKGFLCKDGHILNKHIKGFLWCVYPVVSLWMMSPGQIFLIFWVSPLNCNPCISGNP